MGRAKKTGSDVPNEPPFIKPRRALSDDGRENQLIDLTYNLVEERLRNGTASSQETVHFLRLGSSLARLQKKELEERILLERSKIKAIESQEEIKELYENAIMALRSYGGSNAE